jgi:hypothetical protein
LHGSRSRGARLPAGLVLTILTIAVVLALCVVPSTGAGAVTSQQASHFRNNAYPTQGNSSVASAFDAALNRHASDAALALFSDTATVSDLSNIACLPGPPPFCSGYNVFTTRVQIRGWLEQLVKENVAVKEVGNYNVTGDSVSWVLQVSVNEFRRLNVAPLNAMAQAIVHNGKMDSLTIRLTPESTTKLALGYSANQRTPYSILASGISLGVFVLGLVFPGAAIYYISKVKRLFATVPRLDKPWVLLGAGVGSLLVSLLIEAIRGLVGLSAGSAEFLFIALLSLCSFFVMFAMVLMKRVMVGESID